MLGYISGHPQNSQNQFFHSFQTGRSSQNKIGTSVFGCMIGAMLPYRNTELADRLLQRLRHRDFVKVSHATPVDLGAFVPQRSKCHENVRRWCAENPGHKPLVGWIATSTVFDKHSVVDRGSAGLLDITPLPDLDVSIFFIHHGTLEEFDKSPNQIVALDI